VGKSAQLSQAGIDSVDTVPISETNLTAAGCKQSKKFLVWVAEIQEIKNHHGTDQDTDYRDTTSKLQSSRSIPVVVCGEREARQHEQREV